MERILLCLLLSVAFVGCAPRTPTIEMGPEAEVTHDGLHRVRPTFRVQRAWVKPGFDLSPYSKLLPVDAGIHYRRPPRRSQREFPLSDSQRAWVAEELRTALQREVERRDEWELVTETGPDVLILRAAIVDLVVTADGRQSGRDRTYSQSIGQATFVVELFDSESREILARTADRRSIDHETSSWRNDPIANRAAARRTIRTWAGRLAAAFDAARTLGLAGNEGDQGADDAPAAGSD